MTMNQIVYLNGEYLPLEQAKISVLDRGFVFADGVYEVVRYYNVHPLGMDEHLKRLEFSLGELKISLPIPVESLVEISERLLQDNHLTDASVYWQVTRGVASRHHAFPTPAVKPTVFAMVNSVPPLEVDSPPLALKAITLEDQRWLRCAIKSVALLPNVLARQEAEEAGVDEAILVRDRIVTEGTSRSVFIFTNGQLVTHPLDGSILGSITRKIVIELAGRLSIPVVEKPFDVDQLYDADEVIVVSTTTEVAGVTHVDGKIIGTGVVGVVTKKLRRAFCQIVQELPVK